MAYVDAGLFHQFIRNELGTVDDELIGIALSAAERSINDHCQRSFDVAGTAAARSFFPPPANRWWALRVHDFTTVTSIVDNGNTIAAPDYTLEPGPNVTWSGEVRPYEEIRRVTGGWYWYMTTPTIVITATWGWPAVPDPVKQATLILGKDFLGSRNVSFGTTLTEFGPSSIRKNRQLLELLHPYRRLEAFGIGGA